MLHIVKNYTGDIMNFEMAAEMATDAGITVETVIVADDVAVQDSLYTAGRRGVGTTVLLEKIVGAAAEEGQDLAAVKTLAQRVADNGRSMGMALTSCTVPSAGKPTFDLPEDESGDRHRHPRRARPPPRAHRGREVHRQAAGGSHPRTTSTSPAPPSSPCSTAWAAPR